MKRSASLIFILLTVLWGCQESLEEKAAKEARFYTRKNCPSQMGENLRMDSLTFEPATHTLHYYYTLMGNADRADALDANKARQALLTELKNTTSMMVYKEAGFRFAYTYHSERHPSTILYNTVFSTKDYGQ